MPKILHKEVLAKNIYLIEVDESQIAKKSNPGQFIILRVREEGERIPLTIVDKDLSKGSITLVFQVIGKTTYLLSQLQQNDQIPDFVGPLGTPTEIKKYGNIIVIGGGVGIAEILPVSNAFKKIGNKINCIIGARTKDLLIFENELKNICDKLYITTDDGSYERKGFVTDVLKELIEKEEKIDLIYAVGPVFMMKSVSELTREKKIPTMVSLNPIMVDGTGMCGSCRITVAGQTKCACVDGPEFNAHLIDWDEFINRTKLFIEQEKIVFPYTKGVF